MESTGQPRGTGSGIKLVLAWGIVQTLVNAVKAFQ